MRKTPAAAVAKLKRELKGQLCWKVECDQCGLTLEVGDPVVEITEPYLSLSKNERLQRFARHRRVGIYGTWSLWFFLAKWRIMLPREKKSASSASSKQKRWDVLKLLEGQRIVRLEWHKNAHVRIVFDLGGILDAQPFADNAPDDDVLHVSRKRFCHHPCLATAGKWHESKHRVKAGNIKKCPSCYLWSDFGEKRRIK